MTANKLRGADILVQALERYGVSQIFTVSGNHIMPIFDAVQETGIELVHGRHEAACVHMADAWARMTGQVGFAMATGGQGHANATAGLVNAIGSEVPVVLLSGHAGLKELGRGAFQEMAQADLARPVTKAAWTAQSAATLGHELARAMRIAQSGRPGPVHLSLPIDLLEQQVNCDDSLWPDATETQPVPMPLPESIAEKVVSALASASKPLVLCGPAMCTPSNREQILRLETALNVPVIGMESPRGVNDPSLGAFTEVLAQADLIVLLAKPLDYTLRFGVSPFVSDECRFIVLEPNNELIARVARAKGERLVCFAQTDHASATQALLSRAKASGERKSSWREEVSSATTYRPPQWQGNQSKVDGRVHPIDLCRAINSFLVQQPQTTVVIDGGEFGQWAQAVLADKRRMINGMAGTIGICLPFALSAKAANPAEPVIAVLGDGTFGFHMAEFDTAVRYNLPIIAIVGNDACWNAEYQIQLREYGRERAKGCELLPARYDKVVEALGGHGEYVTNARQIPDALARALASGKPACINVMIEGAPAPIVRRK